MKTDLLIIGAGPAGYTASIYASRYKVSNIVVGELVGGLASESHKICNYPGFPEISGMELMGRFRDHALKEGATEILGRVEKIEKSDDHFLVTVNNGEQIEAKKILLATGSKRRKLGLAREDELRGRGVTYCATCDAFFFRGKNVAVVGGGDSAMTAAIYLAEVANKVIMLVREPELQGEPSWREQVYKNPKIEVIKNIMVDELIGESKLTGVKCTDGKEYSIDGLFIEIGFVPDLSLVNQLELEVDKYGYIITNADQSTNVEGVYAAGDNTAGSNGFRQIVTAASEGSIAAESIFFSLQKS